MVNGYRDMWQGRSPVLAKVRALRSSKRVLHCGTEAQKNFEEIKRSITKETMLKFPDFSIPFHIHTDASCW